MGMWRRWLASCVRKCAVSDNGIMELRLWSNLNPCSLALVGTTRFPDKPSASSHTNIISRTLVHVSDA